MSAISVSHLKRYFKVYKRSPGLRSTLNSFFSRKMTEVKAVDDISFNIKQGELVGFIGPNGAGKTTTLKCLSGLLYPSSGNVSVLNYKPFERKTDFLTKISLVMGQKNQLWWDLPANETFRLNKEIYEIDEETYKNTLEELSAILEVKNLLNIPVRQLSLGQRMKMELIAALIHRPKVLFLDEPTIGLDVVMQKKMRDFIAEYNRRYKATILLTSHYMADVKQLCRRIIIIDRGKLIYDGSLDDLIEKYSDTKIITVVFRNTQIPKEITDLGVVRMCDPPKVVMIVPKEKAKSIVITLLRRDQVEDLNIEEPEIDEIIRLVFNKNKT